MVISSFGSRLFWIAIATTVGAGLSLLAGMSVDFLKTHFPEVGIYALHRLVLIKEAGEVEEKIVIWELHNLVRRSIKSVSNIAGLQYLFYFPYGRLMELFVDEE